MSTDKEIPLFIMNGLGNKIAVVDIRHYNGDFLASCVIDLLNHLLIQFDQLMVIRQSITINIAAYVQIYNNDGSEAEACGNGIRCVAKIIGDGINPIRLETVAGILNVNFLSKDKITVDMGLPKFKWYDIPLSCEVPNTSEVKLQLSPNNNLSSCSSSVCSIGNPHAIIWVEHNCDIPLDSLGSTLENHPIFSKRANITTAKIVHPSHVITRTWERGVGLTKACGSAACAVTACGVRKGTLARRVKVSLPGGDLDIAWLSNDSGVLMTGPAELEHQGVIKQLPFDKLKFEVQVEK